ncbi:hypothetical protein [Natronorubrum sp. DTA28]|uniref:hypothetical protein n=1 Tax=Natronorubrum sp. DTA28 TaxID=3447019 RepID=UPI003F877C30
MSALRVLVIVVLLVCTPVTMIGGGVASTGGAAVEMTDGATAQNETDPHQNPRTADEEGDLEAVEQWLVGRMSDLLAESSAELSEGETDRARASNEEYQRRLGQLADISGEVGAQEEVAMFEQLGLEQEQLIDQVEEYQALEAEYASAREDGDDERARELARELDEKRIEIEETTRTLNETARTVSTETGMNTTESHEAVSSIEEEIDANATEIQTEALDGTELEIDADENVSFLEPLEAEGAITTTDGEPIDADEIELVVENETTVTELEDGEFEFEYRPTDLPLETESLTVAYVPASDSPYASAETSVPVSVEQVEPTLTVSGMPSEVAYEDTVTIESELEVDGDAVNDVPIAAELDRVGSDEMIELAGNETANGSVTIDGPVPAEIPDGEYELVVEVPFSDQAIAGVTSRESIVVTETETDLEIEVDQVVREADDELAVRGAFATADGEVISRQPIEVFVGGVSVGTVVTDRNGEFDEIVPVPEDIESGEVEITGTYDGEETNLESASATSTVVVPGEGILGTTMTLERWVGLGILVAVGLFAVSQLYRWRNPHGTSLDEDGTWEPLSPADTDRAPPTIEPLLLRASAQLSNDHPGKSVQTCYTAVRNLLTERAGIPRTITPRELLTAAGDDDSFLPQELRQTDEDDESASHSERLLTVVDGHERAIYRPEGISVDEARAVLERSVELCGEDETE